MEHDIFQDTIKLKVTQSLGQITEALSAETSWAINKLFGERKDWQEFELPNLVLDLTARLSARVFMGDEYCRNEEWLKMSVGYTMKAMHALQALYKWPAFLRPLANRFLPECRALQAGLRAARKLIEPEVSRRKREQKAALQRGEKIPPGKDTLDWMDEVARGRPFDVVLGQLLLSLVAIHTTSSLLTEVLLDLCAFPEYVPSLREEIMEVIGAGEWKKASLHKLKKMDSFVKETQRLRPNSLVTIRRYATDDVKLSDGTVIPKGSSMIVPMMDTMKNRLIYPNPDQFDGWRFLRIREQNPSDVKAQLAVTSVEHLGFGHGRHACPGRFLAVNEIKIALCHLLMKYDWRLPEGQNRPKTMTWSTENMIDPTARVMIRRREEGIALS
ncbi:uncharacterized protein Z518_00656 [Rhinocladiella mackenziei CBS 650.93]|uniref:Cytochrome P450 monooxygenase n=1 Tax=Rhinocladiella mackenziei CBS 650.93 TaxID=1442369 RepID=A0A0D2J1M5_9EURO|nr:uncharacterized protein Z518_00656 [Rhinocladiella mackenziei CBS 650.93]KIX09576.1 hypothetical protein Z518_00656 [Rhinocladiella mackenziei CBS 650.93]